VDAPALARRLHRPRWRTSPLVSSARENCWKNTTKRTLHKRPSSCSVSVLEAHSSLKLHSPLPVTANGHRRGASRDVGPIACERANGRLLRFVSVEARSRASRKRFRPFALGDQATCQSAASCSALGTAVMYSRHRAASGVAPALAPRWGSTNRLNQTTGRTGRIVSDVKSQQSEEREKQH
jgi:hypothetical protein